jgi:hypothetical protein
MNGWVSEPDVYLYLYLVEISALPVMCPVQWRETSQEFGNRVTENSFRKRQSRSTRYAKWCARWFTPVKWKLDFSQIRLKMKMTTVLKGVEPKATGRERGITNRQDLQTNRNLKWPFDQNRFNSSDGDRFPECTLVRVPPRSASLFKRKSAQMFLQQTGVGFLATALPSLSWASGTEVTSFRADSLRSIEWVLCLCFWW